MKNKEILLWRDLLDLGINTSLAFLRKKKTKKAALKELKASLFRQGQEHWQGLCEAFKKLR